MRSLRGLADTDWGDECRKGDEVRYILVSEILDGAYVAALTYEVHEEVAVSAMHKNLRGIRHLRHSVQTDCQP